MVKITKAKEIASNLIFAEEELAICKRKCLATRRLMYERREEESSECRFWKLLV